MAPRRRYRHALVGTEKRERQKANRARRQAEAARAARVDAVKRNVARWVIVAVAAVAAIVLIVWIAGGFDSDDETDVPVITLAPVTLPETPSSTAPPTTTP